jgi:serralysin
MAEIIAEIVSVCAAVQRGRPVGRQLAPGHDNRDRLGQQILHRSKAARFALDAVFDGIKLGDVKTYFYALFDDGSGKFGLMHQDGTAKPAGAAIHNLMAILADSGTPCTGSLAFGVSAATDNDSALLMEKSNGTFELALWNEKDAAHSVTVNLAPPRRPSMSAIR